jgi:hypothetical protein
VTTQAPILVFGSYGELDVFPSVLEAERGIPPWALDDGMLSAADASGRLLRVLPVGANVCLSDTGEEDPVLVRRRLSDALHRDGELEQLVEHAVRRFGYSA